MRLPLLLAAILLFAATPARAQLAPGTVLRFGDANGIVVRGTLISLDSATIAVHVTPGDSTARYRVATLINAEVLHTERMGFGAVGKGALVGMASGALVGAALGGGKQSGDIDIGRGGAAMIFGVLGAVAGTVVGAVGSVIPVEEWTPVDLARPEHLQPPGSPRWRRVTVGDTVRMTIGDQLQGDAILLGAGESELVLAGMARADTVVVPIATVRRAEVARGLEPENGRVGRATLTGATIGGAVGLLSGNQRMTYAVIDATIGAAIGGAVGSVGALRPEPHWIPFDLATMSISPAIAR